MEEEELLHVNPCPPSWLSDEQKAVLRGDNVEGTAYTQRWLLGTLMTILKALHELLPLLQRDTNLTTYDFTPRKCPVDDPSSQYPATPQQHPLPGETPTFSPQHTNGHTDTAPCTPLRDMPGDQAPAAQLHQEEEDPQELKVVEVPSDVEGAACQLWDMCSDRHVALHVLHLSDGLVLHMLGYALRDPTAPRLTEVLCGVVYNLCCQQEGCDAVLADQSLLLLLTSLPERCTNSSALLQAFRLLHRLLNHCRKGLPNRGSQQPTVNGDQSIGTADFRPHHWDVSTVSAASNVPVTGGPPSLEQSDISNRGGLTHGPVVTALSSRSQDGAEESSGVSCTTLSDPTKTLAVALHTSNLEHFLAFILMNSFCEELVTKTVELLVELLFLVDPHSGKFMADFYAESGLVPGLLRLVSNWFCQKQRRLGPPPADDEEEEEERDYFDAAASSSSRAGKKHDPAAVTTTDTVQNVFICLYAFVDTKGADAIVSSEDDELRLEPALVHYIGELVSEAEAELRRHKSHDKPTTPTSHPLGDDDTDCAHSSRLRQSAERLSYAVKLLELLVRSVCLPEVNLELARLLALLDHSGVYWDEDEAADPGLSEDDIYGHPMEVDGIGCSKTCSSEDLASTKALKMSNISLGMTPISTMRSKSCEESTSQLKSKRKSIDKKRKDNPNRSKSILDHFDILSARNSSTEAKGKKKAQDLWQAQNQLEFKRQVKLTTGSRCRRRSSLLLENSFNDFTQVRDAEEISCLSSSTLDELRDLRRCLEKYFSSILHYWFTFGELKTDDGTLCRLLRVLEQCHVHELLLVLHALRKFDQALVPRVQEMLLDHQAFPRIVALLSKLYQ